MQLTLPFFERWRKRTTCDGCGRDFYRVPNGQGPFLAGSRVFCDIICVEMDANDRYSRLMRVVRAAGMQSWLLVGASMLAVGMLSFAWTPKVRAHDPQTHQADSLKDATSSAFGLCCDGTDYLRVSLWERTEDGFRVYVRGKWYTASPRVKVDNMENPDGEAKVWLNGTPDALYIRCFMPGTLI